MTMMKMRWRVPLAVVVAAAGGCSRGEPAPGKPRLQPVRQVLREDLSGIARPADWLVRDAGAWDALWNRIPATERRGRTLPAVDFSREMVVVVAAGTGNSGNPALTFDGYRAHRDTTDVFVRSRRPAYAAADDITQSMIAGRLPRRHGPVRVIRRDVLGDQ
jgi:hypothetical protein